VTVGTELLYLTDVSLGGGQPHDTGRLGERG
jgi:hypothetical protein